MKTKKIFTVLGSFCLLLSLIGCEEMIFSCIRGNGYIVTEELTISSDFNKIANTGPFEVYLTQSPTYAMEIEAEENLLPYIITRISNEELEIKTRRNRCFRSSEPIILYISIPEIYGLSLSGSGFFICDSINTSCIDLDISGSGDIELGLTTEYIDANISGSGKIELWGTADESDFTISGSGSFRCFDLEQDMCFANIPGSGNMYVYVNELLDVMISGSGKVFYIGNPEVTARISGSGEVIKY